MQVPREELGAPLDYIANKYADKQRGKKFVYGDAWGSIAHRNEAWICIKGLVDVIRTGVNRPSIVSAVLRQQEQLHGWKMYDLESSDMERFYKQIIGQMRRGG